MGKRWEMIEEPDYEAESKRIKRWGEKNVHPQKIGKWNDMVDELANESTLKALNTAVYTMRDLDSGVPFDTVELALNTLCKNSTIKAIVYRVLLNFAQNGPEFLLKSSVFAPFEGLDESTKQNWRKSVMDAKIENEHINSQRSMS